jgi:DNA polymerase III gamma/tau subunit
VITEEQVRAVRGAISSVAVAALVDRLVSGDASGGLATINEMVADGIDLRQLAIQLVEHLRALLLWLVDPKRAGELLSDLTDAQLAAVQAQAAQASLPAIMQAIKLFNQASLDIRITSQPQLVLELAWLDALPVAPQPQPVAAPPPGADKPASAAPAPEQKPAEFAPVSESAALPQPLAKPNAPVPDSQVVEVLRANWTALLHAAESARGPQLRGALRTLRNVVASGDDIHFAFERDFAKTVVEKAANRETVEDLIGQLLGRRVHVHCQVGAQVTGVVPQRPTQPLSTAKPADNDLDQDPVLLHAQQELGAVARKLAG